MILWGFVFYHFPLPGATEEMDRQLKFCNGTQADCDISHLIFSFFFFFRKETKADSSTPTLPLPSCYLKPKRFWTAPLCLGAAGRQARITGQVLTVLLPDKVGQIFSSASLRSWANKQPHQPLFHICKRETNINPTIAFRTIKWLQRMRYD